MSTAPLPYDRVVSFYSYEATYPSLPKRGTDLDAEFNAVRVALNATQARLAEIQREDGLLANASVHPQSLTQETFILLGSDFVPRGSWLTAHTYNPGDLVEHNGLNYLATITHVSNNFDVDLANGKWQSFGGYPTAAQVVFAPAGDVGSVSVQDAIIELDGDIQGKQPASAILSAFAGSASAADKLFYFTGAASGAVATITSVARTFLAASDAAGQRSTLGITLGTAAGNVIALDGGAKIPAVDGSQLTNVVPGAGTVDATQMANTLNLSSKTITMPPANTPAFTKSFVSSQQVITLAGLLTLPHGLGAAPSLFQVIAKCITTEGNWAVGDEVVMNGGGDHIGVANGYGIAIYSDTTNVYVRIGASGFYPGLINKTTGAIVGGTAANWKLIVKAWA